MPKVKSLPKEDRKRQIIIAFAVELKQGNNPEMTMAQIARKLHLSPSTAIRAMIMELVIDGSLDFRDEPIPGIAKFRRLYSPDEKHFVRPKAGYRGEQRPIKINSRQGSFFEVLK